MTKVKVWIMSAAMAVCLLFSGCETTGETPKDSTTDTAGDSAQNTDNASQITNSGNQSASDKTASTDESGQSIESDNNTYPDSKYEDMNIFDEAKKLGYEVSELSTSLTKKYYYVCFTFNGASFLISSAHEPSGDILFYGKEMTEKDIMMGTFGFLTFAFSDGGDVSRDSNGHWIFSVEQKKQLLNLFSNFKESGPSSFIDCCNKVEKRHLSSDLKALVEEMNLKIAYHYVNGGYRFLVSDGKNLAWFAAIYSEADFRPNDSASGLNTYVYEENQYKVSGFIGSSFLTDFVDENRNLNSEPERIDQLRDFFSNL